MFSCFPYDWALDKANNLSVFNRATRKCDVKAAYRLVEAYVEVKVFLRHDLLRTTRHIGRSQCSADCAKCGAARWVTIKNSDVI